MGMVACSLEFNFFFRKVLAFSETSVGRVENDVPTN